MKTTLDLPDELVRAAKIRAVHEGHRLKDVMADLIRRGLAHDGQPATTCRQQVQLPLIQCSHPARAQDEMTPDRVAKVLERREAKDIPVAR